MVRLGVNVDGIARLRAGSSPGPDPAAVAVLVGLGGADCIGATLGGRRGPGLGPEDLRRIRKATSMPLHLRLDPSDAMVARARSLEAESVTLTADPGDPALAPGRSAGPPSMRTSRAVEKLKAAGVGVFLAVRADPAEVAAAAVTGVEGVEIDVRGAARPPRGARSTPALDAVREASAAAGAAGLRVHASGGIGEENLAAILSVVEIEGVWIGASFVARALLVGALRAVAEMRYAIGREIPLERCRARPGAGAARSS